MKLTKILVIDNDETTIYLLSHSFSVEKWHIITAKSSTEGLNIVEKESPDLAILDIKLPGTDGFEMCRQLRQWSQIPIIALSDISETKNKVRCLNLGADDYVTKPFKIDELVARVKAVLRRNKNSISIPSTVPFICDNIKIDFLKRIVFLENNEVLFMPIEYNLLVELVTNTERVFTFKELLSKIWGQEFIEDKDYLYVQISHLRSKLEINPKNPRHIISIPRVGYKFRKD